MLLENMNISRLITHAKQVYKDQVMEQGMENNTGRIGKYEYSKQKSSGGIFLQGQQNV